ncbi:MAG: hypothetical protein EBR27_11605 [Betaproteobacteria bacterium]|nr:hypothetical protein [Betaproteobacteria bacterium]
MRISRIAHRALLCMLATLVVTIAHGQTTVAGSIPGEFAVSSSGAATYRIPIQVPPGVGGMQPKLDLIYNSHGSSGMLGKGWGLAGLSAITRCARTQAQDGAKGTVLFNLDDRYCLDGNRLLMVSGSTYGVSPSEYRTEVETFSKVNAVGMVGGAATNGPAYFVVKTKNGLTLEYGNTADSRIDSTSQIAPRAWALNKVTDANGNNIVWEYEKVSAEASYYPKGVKYFGNANVTPLAKIEFDYGTTVASPKTDRSTTYLGGVKIDNSRLLNTVKTYNGVTLVHTFKFDYENLGVSQTTFLKQVTQCGTTSCLAPTTFQNQGASISWAAVRNVAGFSEYQYGGGFPPNLMYSPQSVLTRAGQAANIIQSATNRGSPAGPIRTDINDDGYQDLVTKPNDSSIQIQRGSASGLGLVTSQGSMHGVGTAGYWLIDINGDGIADYVTKNNDGNLHWNFGTSSGFSMAQTQSGLASVGSDGAWMIDINRDGLADFVTKAGGTVSWNLATGTGFAATQVQGGMAAARVTMLLDINNDGYPDFVSVDDDLNIYWNLGGAAGFAPTQSVAGAGRSLDLSKTLYSYSMDDLNGNGSLSLIVMSTNTWGPLSGSYYYRGYNLSARDLSFSPEQLNAIDDGMGKRIEISYGSLGDGSVHSASSASVLPVKDQKSGPRVVSVARLTNGVGGFRSLQYTYGGSKSEIGTGRGSLGFKWFKVVDSSNGLESYTEFRQDFPYTGAVSLNEQRLSGAGNAGVLKRSTNDYGCIDPASNSLAVCTKAVGQRYFIYPQKTTDASWDLSGVAFPVTTLTTLYGLNSDGKFYGDVNKTTFTTSEGHSKVTDYTYRVADTDNWVTSRPTSVTVTSIAP